MTRRAAPTDEPAPDDTTRPDEPAANRGHDYRSDQRLVAALVRMSVEEKTRLRAEAKSAQLTMQQLYELRLLGYYKPTGQGGRPRKNDQDEELPLTDTA